MPYRKQDGTLGFYLPNQERVLTTAVKAGHRIIGGVCVNCAATWKDSAGRVCTIAPDAVDTSPEAIQDLQVEDEDGQVLGCVADDTVIVFSFNHLGDCGVKVTLGNLDPNNPADQLAIRRVKDQKAGWKVEYYDNLSRYQEDAAAVRYTYLRIRRVVLTTLNNADPGGYRVFFEDE
jgi:hypothetical protein